MILRSQLLGQDFELADGLMMVGRQKNCDITIDQPSVSKQHLSIRMKDGEVSARDLESRNGSEVNGRSIAGLGWVKLRENDVITVCNCDFRIVGDEESDVGSGSVIIDLHTIESDLSGSGSHSISLSNVPHSGFVQSNQLRALLAMTTTLQEVIHTEDVLKRAVAMLLQIFPSVERAAIGFIDSENKFTPKWWKIGSGDPDAIIRISQTIVNHVAETSQAMIFSDVQQDFSKTESIAELPIRSVMCAPMVDADGNVFGLIHVDAYKPGQFVRLDLEVLAAVAVQISLAINCARLHANAVEAAVLRHDVEKAREVQKKYLPDDPPEIEGYDLAGFYRAARHVGGDYIDFVRLPDGRLAIVLGDVVGKGVPAALTMVRLATETRASLEVCDTADGVLSRLNQKLSDDFITVAVLLLDPAADKLSMSIAGHEPPLLRRPDGDVQPVGFEISGFPVGVSDETDYGQLELQLSPGDALILYSDGFPDAEKRDSEKRFGSLALQNALAQFAGTADETVQHLVKSVDEFIDGAPQFDDMCMVCVQRTATDEIA